MFFAGAFGMIFIGIVRFTTIESKSVHDVILNLYFLVLGVIVALS